jgi:hypothetical protein
MLDKSGVGYAADVSETPSEALRRGAPRGGLQATRTRTRAYAGACRRRERARARTQAHAGDANAHARVRRRMQATRTRTRAYAGAYMRHYAPFRARVCAVAPLHTRADAHPDARGHLEERVGPVGKCRVIDCIVTHLEERVEGDGGRGDAAVAHAAEDAVAVERAREAVERRLSHQVHERVVQLHVALPMDVVMHCIVLTLRIPADFA